MVFAANLATRRMYLTVTSKVWVFSKRSQIFAVGAALKTNYFRMTEIPIRVDLNGNTKSKSDEKPEFIVNGKEIKSHAELSKKEYLKELLSPKNKYGSGSNRPSSILSRIHCQKHQT